MTTAATATAVSESYERIPLAKIRVANNVRQELLPEDVDALAGSIELLGQLQPVLVAPLPAGQTDGCEYALTAGFTRYAACEKLGYESIFATCRAVHGLT